MPKRERSDGDDSEIKESNKSETIKTEEVKTTKSKRVCKPVDRLKVANGKMSLVSMNTPLSFPSVVIYPKFEPIPSRNKFNELVFPDYPEFRPNLTPKEILQHGSFGGTYFRPIKSGVTNMMYKDEWKELPPDWLEGLNIKTQIASSTYNVSVNKFKQSCGGDLDMWESSGWIRDSDPYGWFQWYCRFYQGRRSSDDERQVDRGVGVIGAKGRWRNNLLNKCLASGLKPEEAWNNPKISPKIRQLLQHWGYHVTLKDLQDYAKTKK